MHRSRLRRVAALPLAALLVLGATACGDDEPTPEEARRQRVLDRLERSFGDEAADCMIEQFSESILVALDREGALPEGADLEEFSQIATSCVVEDGTAPDSTPGGEGPADSEPAPDPDDPAQPGTETDPPDAGPDGAPPDDPDQGGDGDQGGDDGDGVTEDEPDPDEPPADGPEG